MAEVIRPQIEDINIVDTTPLPTPQELQSRYPLTELGESTVLESRAQVEAALGQDGITPDGKLLVLTGPCSLHDYDSALEYANHVIEWNRDYGNELVIVMRAYADKPRTGPGWPGMLAHPRPENPEAEPLEGLDMSRRLLRDIVNMGVPIATEVLDPNMAQYFGDLITYGSIGARTVHSPGHRFVASGLSYAMGLKNDPEGNIGPAINGALVASRPNTFFGLDQNGVMSSVRTKGNKDAHIILRGGGGETNYDVDSIDKAVAQLGEAGLRQIVVVDASHGNSGKDHTRQPEVIQDLAWQIADGRMPPIVGVMMESHLEAGNQKVKVGVKPNPNQSVTDGCIDVYTTAQMLRMLSSAVRARRSLLSP
jgi:3-deoxy-7-phosphoheptulonate synthase